MDLRLLLIILYPLLHKRVDIILEHLLLGFLEEWVIIRWHGYLLDALVQVQLVEVFVFQTHLLLRALNIKKVTI